MRSLFHTDEELAKRLAEEEEAKFRQSREAAEAENWAAANRFQMEEQE